MTAPVIVMTGMILDNASANLHERAYARAKPVTKAEMNEMDIGTFSEMPICTKSARDK
jgi:hypothetical protein